MTTEDRRPTSFSEVDTKQKIISIVLFLIIIVIIWQVIGLFRGKSHKPAVDNKAVMAQSAASNPNMPGAMPAKNMPQAMAAPKPPVTEREAQLIRMQQELQGRYIAALNELQMLRVARDIAETNQAIMNAKLETISAQKKVVDLLTPPAPPPPVPVPHATYSQNLANNVPAAPVEQPAQEVSYTVISVSQLQGRWSAVIGAQGNLYSVSTGDILPPDGARVVSISNTGIMLEKDGERKKVSLVPAL
ncbi:MAG TPA: hypothetical protein VNC84_01325 [Gammaproteobacteria bacterium]|jgi:type IV pilus biogenesis protein PilP|nr:hypothetical protein [Gammaproteobacteria bacterium]